LKIDTKDIMIVIGIFVPLWGGAVFLWDYNDSLAKKADLLDIQMLVTKSEKALGDLDVKIANTLILTTLYELHGLPELDELERIKYDRANTRLVALKGQRDRILGVPND